MDSGQCFSMGATSPSRHLMMDVCRRFLLGTCYRHLANRDKDAAKYPTRHRTDPRTGMFWHEHNSAQVGDPDRERHKPQ